MKCPEKKNKNQNLSLNGLGTESNFGTFKEEMSSDWSICLHGPPLKDSITNDNSDLNSSSIENKNPNNLLKISEINNINLSCNSILLNRKFIE